MRLCLLGTGGYHPNELRHTASFFLPDAGVAFDAGTGIFRLPAASPHRDLHLFLTHPHWDHIIGLTYLMVPMLLGQLERVYVYGNAHTLSAVRTHLFAEATFHHMPAFEFCPLEDAPEEIAVGDCRVRWAPLVSHPGGSVAYRIEQQQTTFAYVSDTYVDGTYHSFLEGTDTLLHECYFDDDMADWALKTGHSHVSQVVELAESLEIPQLLLTHPDPRFAQPEPYDLSAARTRLARVAFANDQEIIEL